mmetsp:Transcript_28115/g.65366  ORF Transcript_28115/g.65366 Transcript_28115/m.65366 type:complete len:431 (-) Transcript_28115:549-1841(-)
MKPSLVWFSTVAVVLIGVFLAWLPSHRDLQWDEDIRPMAQTYARKAISNNKDDHHSVHDNDDDSAPLSGIVTVVTGSTSGIGKSFSRAMLKLGATVVAVGRSPTKLQGLHQEWNNNNNKNGNELFPPASQLVTVQADFNDLTAIAKAANEILQQFSTIDILCNNAGAHDGFNNLLGTKESRQGYDQIFAVNYLSHVLLTEKLAVALNQSAAPIIIQVSSSYHWGVDGSELVPTTTTTTTTASNNGKVQVVDPVASHVGGSHGFFFFRSQRSYANSKLAQILHARALKEKHPLLSHKPTARVVSVCPGWVRTSIVGPGSMLERIIHMAAFHSDGWGLSSLFLAMFDPEPQGDFYVNSLVLSRVTPAYEYMPRWTYTIGIRDVITLGMAVSMLWFQRFSPQSVAHPSSPESYQTETAHALYEWSLSAVQPYL